MTTIFKYELPIQNEDIVLDMPHKAKFLDAQIQGDTLCAWFLLDPSNLETPQTFRIIGTGHPAPSLTEGRYLATVQVPPLVFHLFEMK